YWAWNPGASSSRQTFDNNLWNNCGNNGGSANNATGYFLDGNNTPFMQYQFINNCAETNRNSGNGNNYAICSFYGTDSSLVQGCSLFQSGLNVDAFVYLKVGATNTSLRGNTVNAGAGSVSHSVSSGQAGAGGNLATCESCYNTIVTPGGGGIYETFGGAPFPSQGAMWVYRNSIIGDHGITSTETSGGPYVFENNASQSPNSLTGSNITSTANLIFTSGLLDSNGNLTATYSSSVGTVGAQIA